MSHLCVLFSIPVKRVLLKGRASSFRMKIDNKQVLAIEICLSSLLMKYVLKHGW